jgi:hypothetical protein
MNCPLSEIAILFGSLPTKIGCPTTAETGLNGVMLLPPLPTLEGTLAYTVSVPGLMTMSLAVIETSLSCPGAGVGIGVGVAVGVGEGVGVGVGTGSLDGTSVV